MSVSKNFLISWKHMLDSVPLKNSAVKLDVSDLDDTVSITVSKKKSKYLFKPISWIIKPRLEQTIKLDSIGTYVWNICDGRRTTESVIVLFLKKFELTFHESRVMVLDYIKKLVERGILVIVEAKKDSNINK